MTERLIIAEYVQKNKAVLSDEAEKIHKMIYVILEEEREAVLDFEGISLLISSFLISAIGKLYGEFKPDTVDNSITYENMDDRDRYILGKVIDHAKVYCNNKELIDEIINGT